MIALAARGAIAAADDAESRPALLPVPAGRGNDLIRALGRHPHVPFQPAQVASVLRDVGAHTRRVDVGVANDLSFLGALSIGYDARTNALANTLPHRFGAMTSTGAGVMQIARTRRLNLTFEGIGADGTHAQRNVEMFRVRQLTVTADGAEGGEAFADGDALTKLPLRVSVLPGALRVLTPMVTSSTAAAEWRNTRGKGVWVCVMALDCYNPHSRGAVKSHHH